MITTDSILKYLKQNKHRYENDFALVKIGLFGSYSRGDSHKESDIDIIVEFKKNTEELSEKKEKLRNELHEVFNLNIDICREKYIKPISRDQILAETKYA